MRTILKLLASLLLVVFVAVTLEQLSYRFSETYAVWRADQAWQKQESAGFFTSILKHLPLSQWANPPVGDDASSSDSLAKAESLYSEQILSHTRPLRDDLYKHFRLGGNLREFEVREVGGIKDMALPRLTIFATMEDVREGSARRVGEKLSSAHALLLHVLPPKEDLREGELSARRGELEGQFLPFLERGIGCGIIHARSSDELVSTVKNLRKEEKKLAAKILAWGKGKSATRLAEAVSKQPNFWVGVVLEFPEPESFLKTAPPSEVPWILALLSRTRGDEHEGDLAGKMIEWAQAGRQGTLPLASRLGGLLHLSIPDPERPSAEQAFVDAFLFECVKRIDQGGADAVEHSQPPLSNTLPNIEEPRTGPTPKKKEPISAQGPLISLQDQENDPKAFGLNEFPVSPEKQVSYDCKMLCDYRAERPELKNMENRDLILMLGKMFESGGLLEEIRKRDEFFVLYYKSLRALETSPQEN
ncbi:MAG: hypothetical protein VB997_09080 [Opitutales bacterium]